MKAYIGQGSGAFFRFKRFFCQVTDGDGVGTQHWQVLRSQGSVWRRGIHRGILYANLTWLLTSFFLTSFLGIGS